MYLVLDGRAGDPTVVVLWRDVQVKGIGLFCVLSAEFRWFEDVCIGVVLFLVAKRHVRWGVYL